MKRKTQVALWADLGRRCYDTGGINDSCARRKSKMGWSEVARCGLGVTCNKPIRASSHIPFKSRALVPWRIAIMTADLPGARQRELSGMRQSNKCPSWPGGDVAAASRVHLLKSGEDCCSHGAWASKRTTCSCCAPSSSPHSISIHPLHQERIAHYSRTRFRRSVQSRRSSTSRLLKSSNISSFMSSTHP